MTETTYRRPRGRPSVKPYEIVKDLQNISVKATSEKYKISIEQVKKIRKQLYSTIAGRLIRGETSLAGWWFEKCEEKNCYSFLAVPVGFEVPTESMSCYRHGRRKRRVFRQCGGYGGAPALWKIPKYLYRILMLELIQQLTGKNSKVVYSYFVNGVMDPVELSKLHNLGDSAEAEKIIIAATLVMFQSLRNLLARLNKDTLKVRRYWAPRYPDVLKLSHHRKFNMMQFLDGVK